MTLVGGGIHISHSQIDDLMESKDFDVKFSNIQIFAVGPQSDKPVSMDYDKVKESCKKYKINLYIHGAYIIPWDSVDVTVSKIKKELEISDKLNAKGVVIHLPKKTIKHIMPFLIKLNTLAFKSVIFLEFKALKSDPYTTFETVDKFNKFCEQMKENKIDPNKIKICIDTAHIYSSGVNEIIQYKSAYEYLSSLDKTYIGLIHLNGNKNDNSIAKDEHAIPLSSSDKMWGSVSLIESGCLATILFANELKIDYILELYKYKWKDINQFISKVNILYKSILDR